jgi:hypothetical protein
MIKGINFITDEKGTQKGILLDLMVFKKEDIKAEDVFKALTNLQQLINDAEPDKIKLNNWDLAKEKLKNLKM